LGLSVTVVEFFDRLLPRQLDAEGAMILQKQMEGMGLKFFLGAQSKSIKDVGITKILELKDGNIIESNFILVSAGIKPNITLAQEAGIPVNKGIVVNDCMEQAFLIFMQPEMWQSIKGGYMVSGLLPKDRE